MQQVLRLSLPTMTSSKLLQRPRHHLSSPQDAGYECRYSKDRCYATEQKDVLTLLAATEEMTTNYADRPIITMSMAGTGVSAVSAVRYLALP